MSRPDQPLTQYEKDMTIRRTLEDAELFKRGATISDIGTVVLGESLLEYVQLSEDLPLSGFICVNEDPVLPSPREDWLNTPLRDVLFWHHRRVSSIPRPLRSMNMPVRDTLVLGRSYMKSRAMAQVGEKSIQAIDEAIEDNEFGLEWKDKPTPEEVANICQRLGQVTARALSLGLRFTDPEHTPSALDIVRTPIEQRQRLWMSSNTANNAYFSNSTKDRLFNYPEVFALEFERQQWEIDDRGAKYDGVL